jgi:hypothetical protein
VAQATGKYILPFGSTHIPASVESGEQVVRLVDENEKMRHANPNIFSKLK